MEGDKSMTSKEKATTSKDETTTPKIVALYTSLPERLRVFALALFLLVLAATGLCLLVLMKTGIVSAEMAKESSPSTTAACPACSREGHDFNAAYCKFCGHALRESSSRG